MCFAAEAYRMLTWHFKSFRKGVAIAKKKSLVVDCPFLPPSVNKKNEGSCATNDFFYATQDFFFSIFKRREIRRKSLTSNKENET